MNFQKSRHFHSLFGAYDKGFELPQLPFDTVTSSQNLDQADSVEKSYTAKDLSVLEGLDAVRKRPGMYIGSTDGRGLMHCLWEIIDNAVDESLAGYCKKIEINLEKDGSIEVHDDGRGIPVDKEPKTGLTGVEVVMTKLHAGGKFGGGSYAATGGLHGVGASVVNALSSRLDVEVDRGGKIYWMSFKRGVAGIFNGDGPNAEFTPESGLRIIGKVSSKVTGTRVKWWSDKQIFLKDASYDLEEIYTRARQTSYLVPGLTLIVNDNRTSTKTSETFFHKGGISEYCHFIQWKSGDRDWLNGNGDHIEGSRYVLLEERTEKEMISLMRSWNLPLNYSGIRKRSRSYIAWLRLNEIDI